MQDSPDFMPPQPSSYYPQSFRPPTPPTFHNSEPVRFSKLLDPIRKITPPEDKKDSYAREEQLATAKKYETPLDQAYTYIDRWESRLGGYEKPLSLHMSMDDWAKLNRDLNFSESDEA